MSARDLFQEPIWHGEELGQPIPVSPHAVSVALLRRQDVVKYEEKKPAVVNALNSGYPRFFIHKQVQELGGNRVGAAGCHPAVSNIYASAG